MDSRDSRRMPGRVALPFGLALTRLLHCCSQEGVELEPRVRRRCSFRGGIVEIGDVRSSARPQRPPRPLGIERVWRRGALRLFGSMVVSVGVSNSRRSTPRGKILDPWVKFGNRILVFSTNETFISVDFCNSRFTFFFF